MPSSLNEQEEIIRKFRSIANFLTVIGAIDCTHIRIKKVNADGGQLYINRKGFSSINVQVVCDADLKIMDIVTRWCASVHDSRIFRECRLKQRFALHIYLHHYLTPQHHKTRGIIAAISVPGTRWKGVLVC